MATRLFHTSDVHFGVEDSAAHDALLQAVRAEQPDLLVCTGDITQRAKHAEYRAAAEWFKAMGVPIWLDPGNHDMPYYNLWERFSDPYRRYRHLRDAVDAVEQFESADVVLIPLKTTVRAQTRFPWSDGVVTDAALADTLAALKPYATDDRHIIITAHHPLLGPKDGSRNPTIGGDRAFAALAAAGANIFLSGHVHVPFDEERTSGGHRARMIGVGTLSTRLRYGAPPSYHVLTCERGEPIEVERRDLVPS